MLANEPGVLSKVNAEAGWLREEKDAEEFRKRMAFQQAPIAVKKTEDFEQLKAAIERVFGAAAVQKFYSRLESKGMGAREFEKIVNSGLLELVDSTLARSGKTAKELWESLELSDQALMREFYLEKIEQVDPAVRHKYRKVYRYY